MCGVTHFVLLNYAGNLGASPLVTPSAIAGSARATKHFAFASAGGSLTAIALMNLSILTRSTRSSLALRSKIWGAPVLLHFHTTVILQDYNPPCRLYIPQAPIRSRTIWLAPPGVGPQKSSAGENKSARYNTYLPLAMKARDHS
jgi:hypothetical protein